MKTASAFTADTADLPLQRGCVGNTTTTATQTELAPASDYTASRFRAARGGAVAGDSPASES